MDELDYLMKEFQKRIGDLSDASARGHCGSYEEYKYVCGQIRGLEAACAVISDLKYRKETQDNE